MITRILNYEEVLNYKWKMYSLNITPKTTKQEIINFIQSKLIKTEELAFNEYPVYINTLTNDIVIITNQGEKIFTRYNYINKGNSIKIELNNKWCNWSQIKKKINTIYFMDSLELHESVRQLWSENGFSFSRFYNEGCLNKLQNKLLNKAA